MPGRNRNNQIGRVDCVLGIEECRGKRGVIIASVGRVNDVAEIEYELLRRVPEIHIWCHISDRNISSCRRKRLQQQDRTKCARNRDLDKHT